MSGKCTDFCTNNCDGDHHAVLLSLNRVRNKETLNQFRQMLRAHLIHGFRLDSGVPDAKPSFRYPLLHWAVVLGKVDALKMLLRPPFKVSPILGTNTDETALHRLLDVMDGKCKLSKVLEMISLLPQCLSCVDEEKNTPFHVCAEALTTCNKRDLERWKQVFYKMVDSVEDKSQCVTTLNFGNNINESVLHILSKRDDLLDLVEYLLCIGVKFDVQNANGETPVEISWRFSMSIYNFYHMIKSTGQIDHGRNNLSEVRTRASLGLSETKDYTEFFKEEKQSDADEDSDDEECSLKRKVSRMNESLINRLAELSEDSPPQERRRNLRPARKRRVVISDSSDSDEDTTAFLVEPERKRPMKRLLSSDSSDNDDDPMGEDIGDENMNDNETLESVGVQLDVKKKFSNEQIFEEIKKKLLGIREIYNGDTSSDGDSIESVEEDRGNTMTGDKVVDGINGLDGRDQLIHQKIHTLQNAIKKLTSTTL